MTQQEVIENRKTTLATICSYCEKLMRTATVEAHAEYANEMRVSHGICPKCYEKVMGRPYEQEN